MNSRTGNDLGFRRHRIWEGFEVLQVDKTSYLQTHIARIARQWADGGTQAQVGTHRSYTSYQGVRKRLTVRFNQAHYKRLRTKQRLKLWLRLRAWICIMSDLIYNHIKLQFWKNSYLTDYITVYIEVPKYTISTQFVLITHIGCPVIAIF